jgi:serine phosphatase RsbU (regulator of sigma subunit)
VFVARYGDGVLRYANAGHLPGHLLNGGAATASRGRDGDAGGGNQMLAPTGPLLGLVEHPVIEEWEVALAPGFRVVVYTDGLLEAYGRMGGLGDQEVLGLVVQGEFALLHERLNTRRPEPLRDDIAAIEFLVPATG